MEDKKQSLLYFGIILCVVMGALIITHSVLAIFNGNLFWLITNSACVVCTVLVAILGLTKVIMEVKDDIKGNIGAFVTACVASGLAALYTIWWSIDLIRNLIGVLQGNL